MLWSGNSGSAQYKIRQNGLENFGSPTRDVTSVQSRSDHRTVHISSCCCF
jgi:hypothetical protein